MTSSKHASGRKVHKQPAVVRNTPRSAHKGVEARTNCDRHAAQGSRAYAAQAMASFTTRPQFRAPLVEAKAIEVLCDLLDEENQVLQVDAMKSLLCLVADDTNNLVTPAMEGLIPSSSSCSGIWRCANADNALAAIGLPNLKRWVHKEHSKHVVAQHAASSLLAAISARFDLRELIAVEDMLKDLVEMAVSKLEELRQLAVREEMALVPVYFHQLTPAVRRELVHDGLTSPGMVKRKQRMHSNGARLYADSASSRCASSPSTEAADKSYVSEGRSGDSAPSLIERTPRQGMAQQIRSHFLNPMRLEIIEHVMVIMSEMAFDARYRQAVIQAGAIGCIYEVIKYSERLGFQKISEQSLQPGSASSAQHKGMVHVLAAALRCTKNLVTEAFGIAAIQRDPDLAQVCAPYFSARVHKLAHMTHATAVWSFVGADPIAGVCTAAVLQDERSRRCRPLWKVI
eukprot:SAG11_NODE_288_length_11198_cov_29.339130_2_plen_457_part_00